MSLPIRLAIAFAIAAAFGGAALVHIMNAGESPDICTAPESLAAR